MLKASCLRNAKAIPSRGTVVAVPMSLSGQAHAVVQGHLYECMYVRIYVCMNVRLEIATRSNV